MELLIRIKFKLNSGICNLRDSYRASYVSYFEGGYIGVPERMRYLETKKKSISS